ncbi:MAG: MarR family winged helix-turn-helix transcriptional regulator [Chitinophagaceae bacterium]
MKALRKIKPQIFVYPNKFLLSLPAMKTSDSKYCQCLYFTANALARKIEKLAKESWSKVELSPSHAYLLMLSIEQPGIQPTALAEHLQLQPSTITRLIDKLEEKKLVVRPKHLPLYIMRIKNHCKHVFNLLKKIKDFR